MCEKQLRTGWRRLSFLVGTVCTAGALPCLAVITPPTAYHAVTNRAHSGISSVAVAPSGRLWLTWYAGPTPGEDSNNYCVLATSADGGRTWKEVLVSDPDLQGPDRAFDPEVWIAPDGKLRWTWTERTVPLAKDSTNAYAGCAADPTKDRLMMLTLDSDAEPDPRAVRSARHISRGVMMCKPLRLSDGKWLFPVAHWREEKSACVVATHDGESFAELGGASIPVRLRSFDEHNLVELKNGHIRAYVRVLPSEQEGYCQWQAESADGGVTWGVSRPCNFTMASSRIFVRRLASGALLLVKNGPLDRDVGRTQMTAWISDDDGENWSGGLCLHAARCAYPDGDQARDGTIYVTYDADRTGLQDIYLAKFSEEDVRAGRIVSQGARLGMLVTGTYGKTDRLGWNANAEWFMYAPSFAFKETAGAATYRFRVLDDFHVTREFVAAKPTDSLAPVWKDVPSGFVTVSCYGVNGKGEVVGLSGERTFWKNAAFREGAYPKARRSHAEAVKLGLEYLLNRKANRYFLEHGKPDPSYDLNCYPAKMHSATVMAMCGYLKTDLPRKDEALKLAKLCADYLIAIAEPEGKPLAGWPHTYEGTKNTAERYAGQQMLIYPAEAGSALLSLYETTKDMRYLAEARRIAATYLRLQGEDGTWYLKLYEKDGKPVNRNRLMPNAVIDFLERLYGLTGEENYRVAADRAFEYIDRGPLTTWNWEGQFEDVPPSEPYFNLTKHSACDTALYLLRRFPWDARRIAQAGELLRWSEDQFIAWETPARKDGVGFRNRPGFKAHWAGGWQANYSIWHCPAVMEQYSWYLPIDASASKLIRTFLAYYKATGDATALAKAKTLGDAAVNNQRDDGLSPTGWFGNYDEYHNWINCHIATVQALQELCLAENVER